MAKWTAAKRKKYLEEHPENFAGPDGSYPIEDASDIGDAWGLAGHAADPAAVRAKIKSIAKRLGLESGLPDTATENDKERSMQTSPHTHDHLTRAAANHEPMTGTHSHAHPAHGSQGDDSSHEHEHSHDNDNNHDHDHEERVAGGIQLKMSEEQLLNGVNPEMSMSMPLVRIDTAKREVWGQATAEVPDSYGTIFGYYPEAWKAWRGNIREQHDGKKAVGRRIELECNEQERAIYVGSRVSRGAQDTWLKVEDNVLTGYSASIIPDPEFGHDISKWPKKEYNGKLYPYLPRYTVAELSLVDNPACPGCNIQIVRADGFATDVLELNEEETASPEPARIERAGARVSAETKTAMHQGIGHTLKAAVSQMKNCGCDDCQAAMQHIDPDGDGDIDMGGYDDPDSDWQSLYGGGDGDMDRAVTAALERILPAAIERVLSPVYARLQGIAGTFARSNNHNSPEDLTGAITRAVEAAQSAYTSSLSEVRADLSAVKETVNKIADTPVPGAPVMNAGSIPRPVEKRLATDPYQAQRNSGSAVYDALAKLSASGQLDTIEKQTDALAAGLVAQRRG